MGAHLEMGDVQPPEQADALGLHPVLRQVQQGQGDRWVFGDRTSGGYMHQFAWTNIVRHTMVRARRPPMTRRWAITGPHDGAKHPCRSTAPHCGCSSRKTGAARSAGNANPRRGPATDPAPMGDVAGDHPQDDRHRLGPRHAGQGWATPSHPPALPTAPASQQGSLEPDARKRARPVLRGARRRKAGVS